MVFVREKTLKEVNFLVSLFPNKKMSLKFCGWKGNKIAIVDETCEVALFARYIEDTFRQSKFTVRLREEIELIGTRERDLKALDYKFDYNHIRIERMSIRLIIPIMKHRLILASVFGDLTNMVIRDHVLKIVIDGVKKIFKQEITTGDLQKIAYDSDEEKEHPPLRRLKMVGASCQHREVPSLMPMSDVDKLKQVLMDLKELRINLHGKYEELNTGLIGVPPSTADQIIAMIEQLSILKVRMELS